MSETYLTTNGEIEDLNTKAKAIAKKVDEIPTAVDTVKAALDDVSSPNSNSKIDKMVNKLIAGADVNCHVDERQGRQCLVRTQNSKVDTDKEHINGRVEAITEAEDFEEALQWASWTPFGSVLRPSPKVSDNLRNVPRMRSRPETWRQQG